MERADIIKTIKVMEKYKFPFTKTKNVNSSAQAIKAAKIMRFPVLLKLISTDQEILAIKKHIDQVDALEKAYIDISKKSKKKGVQIIIQKEQEGIETFVSLKQDAQFGPIIFFGFNRENTLQITPVSKSQALDMIQTHPSANLLKTKPLLHLETLGAILTKLTKVAEDKKIEEITLTCLTNEKTTSIMEAKILMN